ncbi:hypothetical protein [Streptomyces odontomachi]|uniref:hypothetical protein n=1 Tax=Streptomyces odontomachi TaxID=2944940 RepID=UPI00210C3C12|nr:hypothetical protein [Streptomyces sp. ODS25]
MREQTRIAFLNEYRAARSSGDAQRVTDVLLGAVEYDAAHTDGPRLMDELRGLDTPAAA